MSLASRSVYSSHGIQPFLQLFSGVYRYTAPSPRPAPLAEVYSSTAVYSGIQQVYSIQLYSGIQYTAVYIPPQCMSKLAKGISECPLLSVMYGES